MRSLMLALGACLVALNFAGCSSTGSCGCGLNSCNAPLNGSSGGNCDADGPSESCGCGESSCPGGCQAANYGGRSGLGLGLMEAGPSCQQANCSGGCATCRQARPVRRPRVGLLQRQSKHTCGCGKTDCGCEAKKDDDCGCTAAIEPTPAVEEPEADAGKTCGCGRKLILGQRCGCLRPKRKAIAPAPSIESESCGCNAPTADAPSASDSQPSIESESCGCDTAEATTPTAEMPAVPIVMGHEAADCGCGESCDGNCDASSEEETEEVQPATYQDGGLLGKLRSVRHAGSKIQPTVGCGAAGCGVDGKLCNRCRAALQRPAKSSENRVRTGSHGCGVNGCGGPGGVCRRCLAGRGLGGRPASHTIPHRQPPINPAAAGQIPSYVYPYYTTRAPRDFLDPNPPTIGY